MEPTRRQCSFVAEAATSLRQYCRGSLARSAVNRVVELAATIAQQKLGGRLRAAARAEDTSIRQQALSTVAGLFTKSGPEIRLRSALVEIVEADDITIFLRFQAVVLRTVSQELFHRWDTNDPLSARLWRTLHRVLRRDSRFVVFPADRPRWVAPTGQKDLKSHRTAFCHEEIVRILSEQYRPGMSIANLVAALLLRVALVPDRQRVLQIETLFSALREVIAQTTAVELAAHVSGGDDFPELRPAVEKATAVTRKDTAARLDRYLAAGKLTPEVCKCFQDALIDLLVDCCDGGPAQSYYQYLHPHWPDLSQEVYRSGLRAKFEYLAEVVQQRFFDAMKEQLCPKFRHRRAGATNKGIDGGIITS